MLNLLPIEDQLFTCFDFTYSEEARRKLSELFRRRISLNEVLERQSILQYFQDNWKLLRGFSYSRYEMREVMQFTSSAGENNLQINRFFFRKERFIIRAQATQAILFFSDL